MELCFERGRENSMHPSYVRLQNNHCVRKESLKGRGGRNNLIHTSLLRLKKAVHRKRQLKKQEQGVTKYCDS